MISISPIVMTLGRFMKLGLPSPLKFTSRGQGQLASCRFFCFIYIYIYHILNMSLACMLGTCSPKRNLCCKQMLLCHLPAFSSVYLYLLSLFAATLTQSEGFCVLLDNEGVLPQKLYEMMGCTMRTTCTTNLFSFPP